MMTQDQPQWVLDFKQIVSDIEAEHGKAISLNAPVARKPRSASMTWAQRQSWQDREQLLAIWEIDSDGHKVMAGIRLEHGLGRLAAEGWRHDSSSMYPQRVKTAHCDPEGLRTMARRIGLLKPSSTQHKTSTATQLEHALRLVLSTTTGDLPRERVEKILHDYRAGTLPRVR